MTQFKDFINDNFKVLTVILSFVVTLYVQHTNNISRIAELSERCSALEVKLDDQYQRIDRLKLDKTVFEISLSQFISMRDDLKEMRADLKELLKSNK